MLITYELNLDVSRKGVQGTIPITQNDSQAYRLLITLRNGGIPIELDAKDIATVDSAPNIHESAIIHDRGDAAMPNTIEYIPTSAVSSSVGTKRMTLKIYDSDSALISYSAPEFEFVVRCDPTSESDVLKSNPYTAVVVAVANAEKYAKEAEDSARGLSEEQIRMAVNVLRPEIQEYVDNAVLRGEW